MLLHACDGTAVVDEMDGAADAAVDQMASEDAAAPPCAPIGVTGTAPRCKVFAFCSDGEHDLDCNRDDARCGCRTVTGKGRADVPYDPAFCSLPDAGDPSATSEGLEALFAAAAQACGW